MQSSTHRHLHMGCGESLSAVLCERLELLLRPANSRGPNKRHTDKKKKAVIVRGAF